MITFDVRMGTHAQPLGERHGATAVPKVTQSVKMSIQAFKSRTLITNPINSLVSPSCILVSMRC
jgi:hypothetical protein